MDPFLIAVNLIIALMGVAAMALSQRLPGRVAQTLTGLSGLALLLVAVMGVPGETLRRLNPPALPPEPPEETRLDPATSDGQDQQVIYVGNLDALAQALVDRIHPGGGARDKAEDSRTAETVQVPAVPEVSLPEPVVTTPEGPERTLPEEYESDAPPCTDFKLLHTPSGGPEPDGCYAVGCKEGYALPMALVQGVWNTCQSYSRLLRQGDCYIITDKDGAERSMRFDNGVWKPGTCS